MSGFDFALVDRDGKVGWVKAREAGADFAYLNASPGNSVWNQAQAARDAGVTVGPYLFPPIHHSVDAATWAGDVIATVEEKLGDLPVAFDLELPRGIKGTGMDRAGVATWVRTAVARLKRNRAYAPVLYSSARVLDTDDADTMAGAVNDLAGIDGCPLWLAYYNAGPVPTPSAWGRGNYWIHQRLGDTKGMFGVRQVDLDVFNYARFGNKGPRIEWLQRRLGMGRADCDGVFGLFTATKLRAFQKECGLTPDGIVGPKTFAYLATQP